MTALLPAALGSGGGDADIALSGVEPGDLLLLLILSGNTADPRLTEAQAGSYYHVYWGMIEDDGALNVAVTWTGGTGGLDFLREGWVAVAYRGVESPTLAASTPGDVLPTNPRTPNVPPGDHQGAVLAIASFNGVVAGHPGTDSTGEWSQDQFVQLGRQAGALYHWTADDTWHGDPIPQGSFPISGTAPGSAAFVLAVTLIRDEVQVTRQWPRDDGAGFTGGPRLYPPPRGRRTVGGQL